MKPLLEHPRISFITFDFTFDFDKLYNYGINIKTSRIIDIQLSKLPDDSVLNESKDFICSTGWKSIGEFICQTNEDNVNAKLIFRAKESVKIGKRNFHMKKIISFANNSIIYKFVISPIYSLNI